MRSHATVEKSKIENIIYKCIVSIFGHLDKVYLGTAEGDFLKNILQPYQFCQKGDTNE